MNPPRRSRPKPPPLGKAELRLVLRVRQENRRLGTIYRRLERIRKEERSRPPEPAGPGGDLHGYLVDALEHALFQIEEGWAELAGCFSKEGLVFARRKAAGRKG